MKIARTAIRVALIVTVGTTACGPSSGPPGHTLTPDTAESSLDSDDPGLTGTTSCDQLPKSVAIAYSDYGEELKTPMQSGQALPIDSKGGSPRVFVGAYVRGPDVAYRMKLTVALGGQTIQIGNRVKQLMLENYDPNSCTGEARRILAHLFGLRNVRTNTDQDHSPEPLDVACRNLDGAPLAVTMEATDITTLQTTQTTVEVVAEPNDRLVHDCAFFLDL